jgi:hypothetical protein
MSKLTVLLLIGCGLAGCSREAPQQSPASSQPPQSTAANPEPAPPADTTKPAPATAEQPGAANAPAGESSAAAGAAPAPAESAPAAAPTRAATPPPPPAPRFREITVPADTFLSVTLETPLASDTSQVEDAVEGRLAKSVVVSRTTVLPAGSRVTGSVIDVKRSGRVKGRASLVVRFDRIRAHGESYSIRTAQITRVADASTKSDVKKGGIGAGVGAVVGGIAGGGKGAAIGGVLGGTGTVMATRGKEVQLAAGSLMTTRLTNPLEVRVEESGDAADGSRTPEP